MLITMALLVICKTKKGFQLKGHSKQFVKNYINKYSKQYHKHNSTENGQLFVSSETSKFQFYKDNVHQ